jgi:nucleoside phosphorylase
MEGGGVALACKLKQCPMPIVIKSAADWADPRKNKLWQPYCSDVASAFAIEVALSK